MPKSTGTSGSRMEHNGNFPMFATAFLRPQDMPTLHMPEVAYVVGAGGAAGALGGQDTPVKICAVCGDRALSCNFGAITCESCKAFFRRNASRSQEIYSRCDDRCAINVQTRSHCKHCRLLKCFSVGMRAELILTEEQKRERRQKIAENRVRRMQTGVTGVENPTDYVVPAENDTSKSPKLDQAQESAYSKVVRWDASFGNGPLPDGDSLSLSASHCQQFSTLHVSPNYQTAQAVGTGTRLSSDSSMEIIDEYASSKIDDAVLDTQYESMSAKGGECNDHMMKRQHTKEENSETNSEEPSPGAKAAEGHAITQDADLQLVSRMSSKQAELIFNVLAAFRQSFDQPVAHPQSLKPEGTTVDFLNMADLTIRRLVKMARWLPSFRLLGQQYQIDLLKGCVVEVLLLRSIKNFDLSRQGWMTQTSEQKQFVSANVFKTDPEVGAEYFRKYAQAAVELQESTRRDGVVLMLLIVLSLFNSKYLTTEEAAFIVDGSRLSYVNAFKEYLVIKYNDEEGVMYATIIRKLSEFIALGSFHNELLKHTSAANLEPLVAEIFDLS